MSGQEALAALVAARVVAAWDLLDLSDLKGTLPAFLEAVRAIVGRYGRASAMSALEFHRARRVDAGLPGVVPSQRLADVPDEQVVADAVRGVLSGRVLPAGEAVPADVVDLTRAEVTAEVEKLTLDQGRDTGLRLVRSDADATGWAREPNAGACAFCLMLATLGAHYKSAESAGRRAASETLGGDAVGYVNSFHPNCRCQVVPVFGVYEKTARVREAEALWKASTKGLSGAEARKAFRRAVEGRTDGPERKARGVYPGSPVIGSGMSRIQIEDEVRRLEGLRDTPYKAKRLAELRRLLAKDARKK